MYHYHIVNKFDRTIPVDSRTFMVGSSQETEENFEGYKTQRDATTAGEKKIYGKDAQYKPDTYFVQIIEA